MRTNKTTLRVEYRNIVEPPSIPIIETQILVFNNDQCKLIKDFLQKACFLRWSETDQLMPIRLNHSSGIVRWKYWWEVNENNATNTLIAEFDNPILMPNADSPARIFRVGEGSISRSVLLTTQSHSAL